MEEINIQRRELASELVAKHRVTTAFLLQDQLELLTGERPSRNAVHQLIKPIKKDGLVRIYNAPPFTPIVPTLRGLRRHGIPSFHCGPMASLRELALGLARTHFFAASKDRIRLVPNEFRTRYAAFNLYRETAHDYWLDVSNPDVERLGINWVLFATNDRRVGMSLERIVTRRLNASDEWRALIEGDRLTVGLIAATQPRVDALVQHCERVIRDIPNAAHLPIRIVGHVCPLLIKLSASL